MFRYLLGDVSRVMAWLSRLNPHISGEDAGLVLDGDDPMWTERYRAEFVEPHLAAAGYHPARHNPARHQARAGRPDVAMRKHLGL